MVESLVKCLFYVNNQFIQALLAEQQAGDGKLRIMKEKE